MNNYSKPKELSWHDIKRTALYSLVIFVGTFIFEVSTQQNLNLDILFNVFKTSVIWCAWIISTKYFTNYQISFDNKNKK